MTEPSVIVSSPEASLHYEAEVICELRKACAHCGSIHPLSRTPPITSGLCPECGIPAAEPIITRQATAGWPSAEAAP